MNHDSGNQDKANRRRGRVRPAPSGSSRPGPGMGQPRAYRVLASEATAGFNSSFVVREEQTDLWVAVRPALDGPKAASACLRKVRDLRAAILRYAAARPDFIGAMAPLPVDPDAPAIVAAMLEAGQRAGVGPMAAVAGAIAEDVAWYITGAFGCEAVVVENGGDIFAVSPEPLDVAILAGDSPISGKLTVRVRSAAGSGDGVSICTSSGTVGPSRSLGRADAATVVAAGGALADALATALGNRIREPGDIEPALTWLAGVAGAVGGLVVCGGRVGAWVQVEVCPVR